MTQPPSLSAWQELSAVGGARSRMIPSTWCYDKYPDLPELNAGKTVTLIDQDGPGVISCLHISDYYKKQPFDWIPEVAQALILRVWYDGETAPAIEMPLMDFLGDIQCQSAYFNNLYFSKVKLSHNFRLPMPFRKHIRMTVENTSAVDLWGYTEVQWEAVDAIPERCGRLRVDYRTGVMRVPQEPVTLWELPGPGSVVAHWLQFEADDPLCPKGEMLCEGNQEVTLDGAGAPDLEYLGTEDMYGFSWGFQGIQSDLYVAILKRQELPNGGARSALLRSRAGGRIRYEKSCRLVLTYVHDAERNFNSLVHQAQERGGVLAPYRSCVYYYQE
jgi:hypothetical protein